MGDNQLGREPKGKQARNFLFDKGRRAGLLVLYSLFPNHNLAPTRYTSKTIISK